MTRTKYFAIDEVFIKCIGKLFIELFLFCISLCDKKVINLYILTANLKSIELKKDLLILNQILKINSYKVIYYKATIITMFFYTEINVK